MNSSRELMDEGHTYQIIVLVRARSLETMLKRAVREGSPINHHMLNFTRSCNQQAHAYRPSTAMPRISGQECP
jgi:hypothetical protein